MSDLSYSNIPLNYTTFNETQSPIVSWQLQQMLVLHLLLYICDNFQLILLWFNMTGNKTMHVYFFSQVQKRRGRTVVKYDLHACNIILMQRFGAKPSAGKQSIVLEFILNLFYCTISYLLAAKVRVASNSFTLGLNFGVS